MSFENASTNYKSSSKSITREIRKKVAFFEDVDYLENINRLAENDEIDYCHALTSYLNSGSQVINTAINFAKGGLVAIGAQAFVNKSFLKNFEISTALSIAMSSCVLKSALVASSLYTIYKSIGIILANKNLSELLRSAIKVVLGAVLGLILLLTCNKATSASIAAFSILIKGIANAINSKMTKNAKGSCLENAFVSALTTLIFITTVGSRGCNQD